MVHTASAAIAILTTVVFMVIMLIIDLQLVTSHQRFLGTAIRLRYVWLAAIADGLLLQSKRKPETYANELSVFLAEFCQHRHIPLKIAI